MNASSGNINELFEYKTAAVTVICSQPVPDGYSATKSSRDTSSLPSSRPCAVRNADQDME